MISIKSSKTQEILHEKYKTQKNHKTIKRNKKLENNKTQIKQMKQTSLNILSTNADGLKHKAEDLRNKVKYFQSATS